MALQGPFLATPLGSGKLTSHDLPGHSEIHQAWARMGPGVATLLHLCLQSLYYYSCMETVNSSMVNCMEAYKCTNYDSGTFPS